MAGELVVGYDGTDGSKAALDAAIPLAQDLGAGVLLVFGYMPPGQYVAENKDHIEAVRELMPALFDMLEHEEEPSVRIVLGHFMFVYIHPYMDGNGRMGRFLMNLMLASGGYPWTIVPFEHRADYMAALESASVGGDIKPFAALLAELTKSGVRSDTSRTARKEKANK